VDIRSASGSIFAIVDEETGGLLGTADEARVFYDAHPGAVYLHQGEQFEVSELDLAAKVALVKRADPDYYTQARDLTDIEVLDEIEVDLDGPADAIFGAVRVTRRVVGFARKAVYSNEVIDEVELFLPDQTLETKALWWLVPSDLLESARVSRAAVPGTLHAAEHAAIGMLPLVTTCDRWDVGGVSTALHADTGMATIFIYDGYPGGAGIVEAGYRARTRLLEATFEAVRQCPCSKGCPSCVQSPKCGNGNEPLDKQGAVALVAAMLGRTWG
jgi:DEAD/DEAH box helicase domain-containing protein